MMLVSKHSEEKTMKKALSLILVFVVVLSSFVVFAEDTPYKNSNAEKTNAIVDPSVVDNFNQFNATHTEISPSVAADGKSYIWTVKSDIKPGGMYEAYLKGVVMRVNDEFGIKTDFKVKAGDALVFQIPVKNVGNTSSVTVNAALINSGSWGEANVPIECGEDGIAVTDTENWGIVGFTLVMPGSEGEEYKPRLFFGMPEGTTAGQAIAINLCDGNIPKAFVALEEPYRIKLKSDYYDALGVGGKVNIAAEVWNQIGSKGTLDQNAIKWYVTDSKRTKKIEIEDAFAFEETQGGVTLTVGKSAPSGLYSVVAESTVNPLVRYGTDFRVENGSAKQSGEETQIPEKEQITETPQKTITFADVHGANHWAAKYVDYVCDKSLMNGTGENMFSPDVNLSRAMLVTILHRLDGAEAATQKANFADVKSGSYYEKAVDWAREKGIVNGVSDTHFAPDANITREQIAAIMHRYAICKGYDVSVGENTNILSYDDFDKISSYAISAMQYAAGSGMMGGKTPTTLNPLDNATRAEIAAIITRFSAK